MRLHSLRGDVQLERDLLVEVTAGDQAQHLELAHRELVELAVDLRRDLAGERVEDEAGKAGEKRSAANVSQTLRRTEWKRLMKRLPKTLAEYIAEERMNEFAH